MLDKNAFEITTPTPSNFTLDVEKLLDVNQMELEDLQDYLEGLQYTLDNMEPGDSRETELKKLMDEVRAQIEQRKA